MSFPWRSLLALGAAAAALLGAGCQLVFREAAPASEDAAQDNVRLFFVTEEVSNDSAFRPISKDIPTNLTGWKIDYAFADGIRMPAQIDVVGGVATFERASPTTPYTVWIVAPDQPVRVIFGTAATDYESTTHYGRLNQKVFSGNRYVTVPAPVGSDYLLATTGVYADLRVRDCTNTTTADWGCAKATDRKTLLPGPVPVPVSALPSSINFDRVYLLQYGEKNGLLQVNKSADQALDIERQANQAFNATLSSTEYVTATYSVPSDTLCNLQSGVLAGATPQSSWEILAVPAPRRASGGNALWPPRGPAVVMPVPLLTQCQYVALTSVVVGNPFPDSRAVLHATSELSYGFRPATNATNTYYLNGRIDAYAELQGSEFHLPTDSALARNPSINGNQTPRQEVTVAAGPVHVVWETLDTEFVDDFIVTVWRLETPPLGTVVAELRTVERQVTIPADVVPPGSYVITITARRGLPAAAQQDYRQHAYPMWEARTIAGHIAVQ